MNKMKRVAAFFLAAGMACGLSACGAKEYGLVDDTFYGNITLGKYREVEVQKGETAATETDWENHKASFLANYPAAVPVEGKSTVEDGDFVDLDYEGKIDGVAFDGGTAQGFVLEIGSGRFIDDFEQQMTGMEVGQTKDLTVTFPDPYESSPDLAGKDAVFTVKVNAIVAYQTAEEMTDKLVADNTNYDTVEAYKAYVMEQIASEKASSVENQVFIDVIRTIAEDSEISDIPEEITKSFSDNIVAQYQSSADSLGMTLEDAVAAFMGITIEDFNREVAEAADLQAKRILIVRKIIELEDLKISSEEYKETLEAQAAAEGSGFETAADMEAAYGKEYLRDTFLLEKALNIIFDTMIVQEYSGE